MKKIIMKLMFYVALFIFGISPSFSQTSKGTSSEKATVYFVRASDLGALINFTYYDGEEIIGRFNGKGYIKYECEPGEHLFWARSENRSFVEAQLKAGSSYIIEVSPQMGGFKATVVLFPVDKSKDNLRRFQKLISKKGPKVFTKEQLAEWKSQDAGPLERGMKKYKNIKSSKDSNRIRKLRSDMTVEDTDLIFVKKKDRKNKK